MKQGRLSQSSEPIDSIKYCDLTESDVTDERRRDAQHNRDCRPQLIVARLNWSIVHHKPRVVSDIAVVW